MKKRRYGLRVLLVLLLCLFLSAPCALAADTTSAETAQAEMEEQMSASGADQLYDSLPQESKEIMDELGVTLPDINQLNQISPLGVFQTLTSIISGQAENPLRGGILIIGILLLSAAVGSLIGDDSGRQELVSLCVSAFLIAALIPDIWDCLSAACSAIVAACDFSLVYIPVLTALAAANGSVSAAAAYSALTLGMTEVMSQFAKNFLMPCAGIFLGINVAGNVGKGFDFSGLIQAVKKAATISLAFCGTVFTALITTKGVIAKGVDTLALKGAKFVMGSFVPVIGGSMADALGSIMSGLSIVKNSVGIFSILAITAILGPIVIELLLWMLCLNLCAGVADALGEQGAGKLLKGIADGLSLIHTVLLFCMLLLVVSSAVILTIKAEF